jgi:hypothetical protein
LYQRYKSVNSITTLDSSSVADMDGLAGGVSISDINSMSAEVWLSFSATAIKNMPNTTVNSLPSSVLALTTTSQLGSFYTSPYYSSFSDSVKTSLTQLLNGQTLTTSTVTGSGSILIKFDFAFLIISISTALLLI